MDLCGVPTMETHNKGLLARQLRRIEMRFWSRLENWDKKWSEKMEPYGDRISHGVPDFLLNSSIQFVALVSCISAFSSRNSLNSASDFVNLGLTEILVYCGCSVAVIATTLKIVMPPFAMLERRLKSRFSFRTASLILWLTGLVVITFLFKFVANPVVTWMGKEIFGIYA